MVCPRLCPDLCIPAGRRVAPSVGLRLRFRHGPARSGAPLRAWGAVLLAACIWTLASGCQSSSLTAAKIYLRDDQPEQAREKLEAALEKAPLDPEIHFLLGRVAAAQGDYRAMAGSFSASLDLSPRFAEEIGALRRRHWAEVYNQGVTQVDPAAPDLAGAAGSFQLATVIDPEPIEAWRNLGYVYFALDSLEAAIGTYRHIAAAAPGDTSALASLGVLYLNRQSYPEAAEVLASLVEITPGNAQAWVNLGVAHEQLQHLAEAENAYRQAIAADPGAAAAHYNLGNLHCGRDEYRDAIAAYRKAVELDPEDDNSLYNLAISHLSVDELDAALPLLQELSGRMPDNPSVWRELGRIYALKGMLAESRHAYDRAEELAP